uniref:Uncharacterized protein LTL4 n=1 Tax=Avian adenovirus 8 (strain ATCC A-2A) TaxID=66295 RepID=Q9YYR7_ADEG8|nr:unknown [Fowl aviadenovirus 8]
MDGRMGRELRMRVRGAALALLSVPSRHTHHGVARQTHRVPHRGKPVSHPFRPIRPKTLHALLPMSRQTSHRNHRRRHQPIRVFLQTLRQDRSGRRTHSHRVTAVAQGLHTHTVLPETHAKVPVPRHHRVPVIFSLSAGQRALSHARMQRSPAGSTRSPRS